MINNIVFDFGQTLVYFDPLYMTSKYVENAEDARLVARVLFDRLYWDALDEGKITNEEVVAAACARLPERLHGAVSEIYYGWIDNIPEIEGMREVVESVRRAGKRVLLLSNISEYFVLNSKKISILSLFDGCVFSCRVGAVKPSPAIFAHLCEKFDLRPEETLFIDDSEKNIRGAEEFGIKGYLFDGDAAALTRYLAPLL